MSVAPRPHGRALPEAASRRGWCPGLTRPMPTGDGLLARVHPPLGVLTLGQARAVAEGARRFGNGHLDLTARANLQIRGVTEATQASLAAWLSAQGLGDVRADGGPQRLTLTSPLAGRDPEEAIDVPGLARAVEAAGLTIPGLPAKTLVVIEGRVDRATAEADCAVIANAPGRVAITIACGEGRQDLLTCGEREAPDVVAAVLTAFARTGRRRMRDLSEDERATLTEALRSGKRPHVAARGGESVWPGQARQPRGGQDLQILAIDAPFGRSTADALDRLADAALTLDADELRLSPTRGFMLLAPGRPGSGGARGPVGGLHRCRRRPAAGDRCLHGCPGLRLRVDPDPHRCGAPRGGVRSPGGVGPRRARLGMRQGMRPTGPGRPDPRRSRWSVRRGDRRCPRR